MREVKPTQKPVPSSDIKDLFFNSGLLDIWATSLERKYIDRFGNCHLTATGMEWLFKELVDKFKVDMNIAIVAAGYITIDSFQQGADLPNNELTQRNQILRDETTGEYYRWDGDFPKQVTAGSTPQSTGGIGKGAWVSVGDASLRSNLGKITKTYDTYYAMTQDSSVALGGVVETLGYYESGDGGGAVYTVTTDTEIAGIHPKLASNYVAVLRNEFTVKALSCGVKFDGVATIENTKRYENAANYCAQRNLTLKYPAGTFKAASDITVVGSVQDVGVKGFNRYQISSIINMGEYCLHRIGSNARSDSVVFLGNDDMTENDKSLIKLTHPNPENRADIDAQFIDCNISGAYRLIDIIGRGITLDRCSISSFRRALRLDWNDPFTPPNNDFNQNSEQGMRGYIFNDCRFHGATYGYIFENVGKNKNNARGLYINGGYADTGCGYVYGSANDFYIDMCHIHAYAQLFVVLDGEKLINGKVTGIIKGMNDGDARSGLYSVLHQRGDTSVIDNVTFDLTLQRNAFATYSFSGVVGNVSITGNHKDICLQNNSGNTVNYFCDMSRVKSYAGDLVIGNGSANYFDNSKSPNYLVSPMPEDRLHYSNFTTSCSGVSSRSIRGRSGNVSRHRYVGDGTGTRSIKLPAKAMYCIIQCLEGVNKDKQIIAINPDFGGTGDALIRNDDTLEVKGAFNTSNVNYLYIVNY